MAFKVVFGAPCSGKSTFVAQNKGDKDVVYDYDRIASALTMDDSHTVKDRAFAHRFMRGIRGTMTSIAKAGDHKAENVWMIISHLTDDKRKMFDECNAEYIEMDTSEQECLERLEKDDSRPDKEAWAAVIKDYFAKKENKRMATPADRRKFKNEAQCRSIVLSPVGDQKRLDTDYYVDGYAALYAPYLLYDDGDFGKTFERFEPGCFERTDMSDIIMQFDHAGRVFARTTNQTLIVEPDDKGLFIAADLGKTEGSRSLYGDIASGLVTKMSWRFRVGSYRIERTEGSRDVTIVHTEIPKIYDVSAVSIPANNDTEINARDFIHGVMDEAARSEAELDDIRLRMKMKLLIGGIKHDH